VVVGAGLAGLVTTLELLECRNSRILLVDRCTPYEVGGLAREAFGGMFMVDTREQRFSGIGDSVELALEDWLRVAEFEEADHWPRRWAQEYVARARDEVGGWLKSHGVQFFPVVNWAERGVYGDGNSVPRFHLAWGCGQALVDAMWDSIQRHPGRSQLEVRFGARVTELVHADGAVRGCRIVPEDGGPETEVSADQIVIAAGGVGGNLDMVRREWPSELGRPPAEILMGSHYYADGAMHEEVKRIGGNVTHISRMWNYADAVRHPHPKRPLHGLKLIPPRSGLVLDPTGRRYGPTALIPTFDAYYALQRMNEVTGDGALDMALMESEVNRYDATIARGKPLFNDDQLRRIYSPVSCAPTASRSQACTRPARRRVSGAAACTGSARSKAHSSVAAYSPAGSPRARSPACRWPQSNRARASRSRWLVLSPGPASGCRLGERVESLAAASHRQPCPRRWPRTQGQAPVPPASGRSGRSPGAQASTETTPGANPCDRRTRAIHRARRPAGAHHRPIVPNRRPRRRYQRKRSIQGADPTPVQDRPGASLV
jgi:FAD binding domain